MVESKNIDRLYNTTHHFIVFSWIQREHLYISIYKTILTFDHNDHMPPLIPHGGPRESRKFSWEKIAQTEIDLVLIWEVVDHILFNTPKSEVEFYD